jgi:hypothetical protein
VELGEPESSSPSRGEGRFHEFQVQALCPIVSQMLHPGERGVEGVLVSVKDAAWLRRRCL